MRLPPALPCKAPFGPSKAVLERRIFCFSSNSCGQFRSNGIQLRMRLSVLTIILFLPFVVSNSDAQAGRASRGTLELVNPTSKSVTCHLISFANERAKGEYLKRGAHATAKPKKTARGNKSFFLVPKQGVVCYFTEDYPNKPDLNATIGAPGVPNFCRTNHFTTRANSIIRVTPRTTMSNCTVSSRPGAAPREAQ